MGTTVFYDDDARRRILAGAETLYNAVKTTMGPKGRNVIVPGPTGPSVTHDGVTVAKAINITDVNDDTLGQRVGAELIKQAASKMNDVAGDGTTTVTVLTYHILNEANKLIAAGHNPMTLRKGLEETAKELLVRLEFTKTPIEGNKKRIAEVATISAGDKAIGQLIADVIHKVGKEGVVTVEEGQGLTLESEVVQGFTFDRGYISTYFITDSARMKAAYKNPAIIITDKRITSIQDFLPLIEKLVGANKKELLLIADNVEGEALGTLVLNKLKGSFNTIAVRAPSFGNHRSEILQDLATLTGATVITEDSGMNFEDAGLEVVGSAKQVIVTNDETTIIEGQGASEDVSRRLRSLEAQLHEVKSEYERENIEKRKAAIAGKVAIIRVGGATEAEIEEKKYRVDDAVHAVKAALLDGIVPGGGVTLLNFAQRIKIDSKKDTAQGAQILKYALAQPFNTLLENAGISPDYWQAALEGSDSGFGIDVNNPGQLIDMVKHGIVDPARVTKEVLQLAISLATTISTMGAIVVEVPQDTPSQPQPQTMQL